MVRRELTCLSRLSVHGVANEFAFSFTFFESPCKYASGSSVGICPVVKALFDCSVMHQDKPTSRECLTSIHERDGTLLNLNEQEYLSYCPRLSSIYESPNIQYSCNLTVTFAF